MLFSLGLFFNWSPILIGGGSNNFKNKVIIFYLILDLLNLIYLNNFIFFDLILLDGLIKINNHLIFQLIIILIFYILILLYIPFLTLGPILIFNLISGQLLLLSNDLLLFFINWELFNLSLYFIILTPNNFKSLSITIKYFFISSLSTSILLLGIIYLYFNIGNLQLDNILLFLEMDNFNFTILILLSILFKLGVIPFHYWILDLYQNNPININIFLMIIPKIIILFILNNYISIFNFTIIYYFSIFTLILGSFGLIQQLNFIRFLTYSSITNLGYLLLTLNNYNNLIINIIIYNLTIFIILFILFKLPKIKNINDINFNNLFLSIIITLSFFSLAGLPPLSGFIGKLFYIEEYLNYEVISLFFIIILNSIIIIYNYLLPLIKINFKNYNIIISLSLKESIIITLLIFIIITIIPLWGDILILLIENI